jgi:mannan endo-1,4-beta-mannosidase
MGLMRSARLVGGIALAGVLPVAALVGSVALSKGYSTPIPPPPRPAVKAPLPQLSASYLGVFEVGAPDSYSRVRKFTTASGRQPNIALYFSKWQQPFATSFAQSAHANGATVLVQLDPNTASLSKIAAGHQDFYLKEFARQVRAFHYRVIISFAHEMNGNWYPWGAGKATPREFRRAWRHVVWIFRKEEANNVTWLWAVHSIGATRSVLHSYWPGKRYVDWVGLDGYYAQPTDDFKYIFGNTLQAVRKVAKHKPVLISETAVGPDTHDQPGKIRNLFRGIRSNHLLGLVWFDRRQNQGLHHQDWRLEDSATAMKAFHKYSRNYP